MMGSIAQADELARMMSNTQGFCQTLAYVLTKLNRQTMFNNGAAPRRITPSPKDPIMASGQLKKSAFGYSVPIDAPLYTPFPLYYENVDILLFPYLTTAAQAAALLPEQFDLVPADSQGQFAIAQVVFARYGFSNIGAYNEVAQTIVASYKGVVGAFAVRLHVTSDQAMAAGREIGGFPKKLGHITFNEGATNLSTLECPKGLPICSGELDVVQPVQGSGGSIPLTYFSVRVIPNPENEAQPSLCQLIQTTWVLDNGKLWSGRGNLHFTGASGLSPYHLLPVVKLMPPLNTNPQTDQERNTPGVGLFRGSMTIGQVKVLENF
jgi:acetoacetate decarboxylase